jgi:hypothetical protein
VTASKKSKPAGDKPSDESSKKRTCFVIGSIGSARSETRKEAKMMKPRRAIAVLAAFFVFTPGVAVSDDASGQTQDVAESRLWLPDPFLSRLETTFIGGLEGYHSQTAKLRENKGYFLYFAPMDPSSRTAPVTTPLEIPASSAGMLAMTGAEVAESDFRNFGSLDERQWGRIVMPVVADEICFGVFGVVAYDVTETPFRHTHQYSVLFCSPDDAEAATVLAWALKPRFVDDREAFRRHVERIEDAGEGYLWKSP